LSEAISPGRRESRVNEIGGGAIPTSLANEISLFLRSDIRIGIENLLVSSPRRILEDTIRNREWFKGIVLSSAFIEHFGSVMLEKATRGGIRNKDLNLQLDKILRLLRSFRLVTETTYSRMQKIKKARNHLVHNPFAAVDPTRARQLIEDAIECLESMGVADDARP